MIYFKERFKLFVVIIKKGPKIRKGGALEKIGKEIKVLVLKDYL